MTDQNTQDFAPNNTPDWVWLIIIILLMAAIASLASIWSI